MNMINTFVFKEPTRVLNVSSSKNTTNWYTNQVQDLSIKVDGEEQLKKDAQGNTMLTKSSGKTCELSFSTPVYDVNIVAAQNGTTKEVGTSSAKLVTPDIQEYDMKSTNLTTVVLPYSARQVGDNYIINVNTLNADGSLKDVYKLGSAASGNTITYTANTKTLTFAEGALAAGDTVLVVYEYESENVVRVVATGKDFPKTGKTYVEVLGCDPCDPETAIYAYYTFPNTKMKSSYQHDLKLDSTINITMDCAVDYCSKKKEFYTLAIPFENDNESEENE